MAQKNKDFQLMNLKKEVKNINQRVHIARDKEKMDEVADYATNWYWQNQQLVFSDEWNRKGLNNICKVKSYGAVNPLYVEVSERENFIGSKIAFSITANMEDYLVNKTTGQVVEGKPGYDYEELEKTLKKNRL